MEGDFRFRGYIDPTGTSRFAAIPGDTIIRIVPGPPAKLLALTPPLVKTGEAFPLLLRVEDRWGNVCRDLDGSVQLEYHRNNGEASNAFQLVRPDYRSDETTCVLLIGVFEGFGNASYIRKLREISNHQIDLISCYVKSLLVETPSD